MILTLGEVHRETGVPMHVLRRLALNGHIPAKRPPNGFWRIPASTMPEIKRMLTDYGLIEPEPENANGRKAK